MNIPYNQFTLFVVVSSNGTIMGAYQTFKQAYERISGIVKGNRLVEVNEDYNGITYASESNHNTLYRIEQCLFTYDETLPIIRYVIKEDKYFSTLIN